MPEQQQTRTRMISLRLTEEEYGRLERQAVGMSLGGYIRIQALKGDVALPRSRGKFPVKDHQALAKALAKLGQSAMAGNLAELAHAARSGSLPLTPEIEAIVNAAYRDILAMKTMLMKALGIRER